MKKNILITVTNENLIPKYKDLGYKMVFPLSFFCVGIPKTFNLEEITYENSYLYVNRILDSNSANKLNNLLHHLPTNIVGIIFDDVGIIEMLKDVQVEKILYNTHFCTNYRSINYYFDYVDEIIVSPDITEEEIDEIIKLSKKKIGIFAFGLVPSMYSRRVLLTNFAKHNNVLYENQKLLYENNQKFIAIENDFGTYVYHFPYYNALRLLEKDASFFFYHPLLLDENKIDELINNNLENIEYDEGFLDTKTIYKIKEN